MSEIELEQMVALTDGWSEWIHPLPGYLIGCCDCGLVHEAQFKIVDRGDDDGDLNEGEGDKVIILRMRRHHSGALNEMVALDEQLEAENPGWMDEPLTPTPSAFNEGAEG